MQRFKTLLEELSSLPDAQTLVAFMELPGSDHAQRWEAILENLHVCIKQYITPVWRQLTQSELNTESLLPLLVELLPNDRDSLIRINAKFNEVATTELFPNNGEDQFLLVNLASALNYKLFIAPTPEAKEDEAKDAKNLRLVYAALPEIEYAEQADETVEAQRRIYGSAYADTLQKLITCCQQYKFACLKELLAFKKKFAKDFPEYFKKVIPHETTPFETAVGSLYLEIIDKDGKFPYPANSSESKLIKKYLCLQDIAYTLLHTKSPALLAEELDEKRQIYQECFSDANSMLRVFFAPSHEKHFINMLNFFKRQATRFDKETNVILTNKLTPAP